MASLTTAGLALGCEAITATFTPSETGDRHRASGTVIEQVNLIDIALGSGPDQLDDQGPSGITIGPVVLAAHESWTDKPVGDGKGPVVPASRVTGSARLNGCPTSTCLSPSAPSRGQIRHARPTAPTATAEPARATLKVATD